MLVTVCILPTLILIIVPHSALRFPPASTNLLDYELTQPPEIPQYVPGAAYRQLEFLLGRIDSLEQKGDFSTQSGNFTGHSKPSKRSVKRAAEVAWSS